MHDVRADAGHDVVDDITLEGESGAEVGVRAAVVNGFPVIEFPVLAKVETARVAVRPRLEEGAEMRQGYVDVGISIREGIKKKRADIGESARLHAGRLLSVCCEEAALADFRGNEKDAHPALARDCPAGGLGRGRRGGDVVGKA